MISSTPNFKDVKFETSTVQQDVIYSRYMKIVLTGASGMVGAHILKHLLKVYPGAYFICPCSWRHKGEPDKLKWARKGNEERVTVLTHDLSAPFTEGLKKQIGQPDYILNIASDSHVDRSITEPVDFVQNNINLVLNMLELARETKPKMFLQFSTDEVFGYAPEGTYHKEWSVTNPSNPYSASKAAQEALAISYWRTYTLPVVITNTMNVFSELQDWEKFIPLCVKRILNGEKIYVHSYPGEEKAGSRFYIHGDSVAEAIARIMETTPAQYPDNEHLDRYNIVGDEEVDNLTLAQTIANILGQELIYELTDAHSSRPGHDVRYALDGTKMKEMGWEPSCNYAEKLKEVVLALKEKHGKERS